MVSYKLIPLCLAFCVFSVISPVQAETKCPAGKFLLWTGSDFRCSNATLVNHCPPGQISLGIINGTPKCVQPHSAPKPLADTGIETPELAALRKQALTETTASGATAGNAAMADELLRRERMDRCRSETGRTQDCANSVYCPSDTVLIGLGADGKPICRGNWLLGKNDTFTGCTDKLALTSCQGSYCSSPCPAMIFPVNNPEYNYAYTESSDNLYPFVCDSGWWIDASTSTLKSQCSSGWRYARDCKNTSGQPIENCPLVSPLVNCINVADEGHGACIPVLQQDWGR